jgi:hypothetical protein
MFAAPAGFELLAADLNYVTLDFIENILPLG